VFVDLKLPGDISNTIAAVIDACVSMNVELLTLSESMPRPAIRAARAARAARNSSHPKFLTVPVLSSLDASDLPAGAGGENGVEAVIVTRAQAALDAGCDGIIASGDAIQFCRRRVSIHADRQPRHPALGGRLLMTTSGIRRPRRPSGSGPTIS
jgi:orotidine-5'-phosphate decarboxylase